MSRLTKIHLSLALLALSLVSCVSSGSYYSYGYLNFKADKTLNPARKVTMEARPILSHRGLTTSRSNENGVAVARFGPDDSLVVENYNTELKLDWRFAAEHPRYATRIDDESFPFLHTALHKPKNYAYGNALGYLYCNNDDESGGPAIAAILFDQKNGEVLEDGNLVSLPDPDDEDEALHGISWQYTPDTSQLSVYYYDYSDFNDAAQIVNVKLLTNQFSADLKPARAAELRFELPYLEKGASATHARYNKGFFLDNEGSIYQFFSDKKRRLRLAWYHGKSGATGELEFAPFSIKTEGGDNIDVSLDDVKFSQTRTGEILIGTSLHYPTGFKSPMRGIGLARLRMEESGPVILQQKSFSMTDLRFEGFNEQSAYDWYSLSYIIPAPDLDFTVCVFREFVRIKNVITRKNYATGGSYSSVYYTSRWGGVALAAFKKGFEYAWGNLAIKDIGSHFSGSVVTGHISNEQLLMLRSSPQNEKEKNYALDLFRIDINSGIGKRRRICDIISGNTQNAGFLWDRTNELTAIVYGYEEDEEVTAGLLRFRY